VTRENASARETHESILAEVFKMGPLLDAACEPQGREVAFERILLNAPIIHSRYKGDVSGTLIAEQAAMSLGNFKFSYDSIFSKVPVLPFLQANEFLAIF
jgi:hypothetical protein